MASAGAIGQFKFAFTPGFRKLSCFFGDQPYCDDSAENVQHELRQGDIVSQQIVRRSMQLPFIDITYGI